MTQPDYVPLRQADRVRPSDRLTLPLPWQGDRPADLTRLAVPGGSGFGRPGPDGGYGLKLAKRFVDRFVLVPGEHADDVLAGGFACGTTRAAGLGRAPVIYDMAWAFTLWGYLAAAPEALVELRVRLFRGAAHDYADQRAIVDSVAPAAFKLGGAEVAEALNRRWQDLFVA